MSFRCSVGWILVLALLVLPARVSAQGSAESRRPDWLARLSTWSKATAEHAPGRSDPALVGLAAWTAEDLTTVVDDFLRLRRELSRRVGAVQIEHKKDRVAVGELRALDVFKTATGRAVNDVLERAAVLHADVALLATRDWSRSTGPPDTVQVRDGLVIGHNSQSAHWIVARRLLDAVEPSPMGNPFVARWYSAVAASLLEGREYSAARPHLEYALDLLPGDAGLRYHAGCYHQASAGPALVSLLRMQKQMADRRPPGRRTVTTVIETADSHWKAAAQRFREAVTLDSGLVKARVRLGYALLQLDRAGDAAVELRRAAAESGDGDLGYFAYLFLGLAEERLGRVQAADASYGKAVAIRPDARSPRLARAFLLRRAGNRDDAWRDVSTLVTPPVPRQADADPWWRFFTWQSATSRSLMDEVRASLSSEVGK